MAKSASFPLTLALSRRERENLPPRLRQSRAPGLVEARDAVFPLPAGEGQGEGNETPPTKTAGRILHAQPDRFLEPATSGGFMRRVWLSSSAVRKRIGLSRPSPAGEGGEPR